MRSLGVVLVAGAGGLLSPGPDGAAAQRAGESLHSYFESLAARPDVFASFSLRSQEELERYRAGKARPSSVSYVFPNDPYPHGQDAAKVVVPAFTPATTLAAAVSASDSSIEVASGSGAFVKNRHIQVDGEIMAIVARAGTKLTVERGQLGTARGPHQVNAAVSLSTNSLPNQVWLPLGTRDGHTYFATWDAWYGAELRRSAGGIDTWKTFQFDAPRHEGGKPTIWFEVRTRFDLAPGAQDIGVVDARGYSTPVGPNVAKKQPLKPSAGNFVIRPETWIRYWVLLEQRSSDWDLISLWAADKDHDAIKLIDRLQFEAHEGVSRFRLEFNTSKDPLGARRDDVVAYVRNFVMLQDPANWQALMQRPRS